MKLVDDYDYRRPSRELIIVDAVETACDGEGDGMIERNASAVVRTATLLGRLVQELHAAGVLTDDAVLNVVGDQFTKVG